MLDRCGVPAIDGALFDLGVSSMQFDDPDRGFSIGRVGADRHADGSARAATARTTSSRARASASWPTSSFNSAKSGRLAESRMRSSSAVRPAGFRRHDRVCARSSPASLHRPGRRERIHPATRVFQALRIAVNDELEALREGLTAAVARLRGAGRVVVISFHSLEDRIVKQAFRGDERLEVLTKKPLAPEERETSENPRARSAKLRAAARRKAS